MEITEGIEAHDCALYIKATKTLVISDIHLGYEEWLEKQGVLVPRQQLNRILEKLRKILEKIKPHEIVLNGDLKHEFGKITNQERNDIRTLLEYLLKYCNQLTIVKGNHDIILEKIVKHERIKLVKEYNQDGILFVHGDTIPDLTEVKTIIIGHDHPAITLKEGAKYEKYKCYLIGKFLGRKLIAMPSINPLAEGSDILKEKLLSPLLQKIEDFSVAIISEKILPFGKIKNIKNAINHLRN